MTSTEESQSEHQPIIPPTGDSEKGGESITFSKAKHHKNLFILSLTLVFCMTDFGGIQNVQSSINSSRSLGLLSLSVVYASLVVSTLLTPTVIKFFKPKWTITVSAVCFCIYTFGNFYPHASLVSASCIVGFSSSTLWVATTSYITTSAFQYAKISGENAELVISRFNCMFYSLYQTNQIWGNLISYSVLKPKGSDKKPVNVSVCGMNSCGASINIESTVPDKTEINMLLGVFSLCGFISVLLALFLLDELPSSSSSLINVKSWKSQLVATLKMMGNIKLILLLPLVMYSGMELGFLVGDFTKAFITCTHDVPTVGLIMIGFGISGVISGPILFQLRKKTDRIFLFSLAAVVQLSLLVYLYLWDPKTSHMWQLFLVTVGWGFCDATWMIQIFSLVGVVFPNNSESAFSNCVLWQAAGVCISMVTSIPQTICIFHKLIAIGSWLILSMLMYYVCEFKIRRPPSAFVIQNS